MHKYLMLIVAIMMIGCSSSRTSNQTKNGSQGHVKTPTEHPLPGLWARQFNR